MSRSALKSLRRQIASAARESGAWGIYCDSGRYSQVGYPTEMAALDAIAGMTTGGISVWPARN